MIRRRGQLPPFSKMVLGWSYTTNVGPSPPIIRGGLLAVWQGRTVPVAHALSDAKMLGVPRVK